MDSKIKLLEMTKREMSLLKTSAVMASLLSAILAATAVGILSLPSIRGSGGRAVPKPIPNWLIFIEIGLGSAIFLVSAIASACRLAKSREPVEEEEERCVLIRLQRASTWPLLAAVLLSLPWRSAAEITGENDLPNVFLLLCADTSNAFGVAIIMCYLWVYPFTCGQSTLPVHNVDMDIEHPKLPFFHISLCSIYATLRLVTAFVFMIHLKPLPLQNVFVLLGMVVQSHWTHINVRDVTAVAVTSILELAIFLALGRDLRKQTNFLASLSNTSVHQIIIALRFFQHSSVLLLFNILSVSLMMALVAPSRGKYMIEGRENLILSQPLGHSAVSLTVTAYALAQFYVHHSWNESGIIAKMWDLMSAIFPGDSPRRRNDLVYRVSDERNPLTEFPVPQKNTFSLETATLLFNMAWLATVNSGGQGGVREPSDFGRPKYALHSVIAPRGGNIGAILLQGVDRIIVAFKPVSADDLKHSYLLPLSKTFLGRSLTGKCMELDVLRVKGLSAKDNRLFRKCRVHAGFETVYSSVQGNILREVSSLLRQRQRPIFVTGYGSGGAVATLCSLDLSMRCFTDQGRQSSVYTFGAMKVMNPAMVQLFEAHVPFRWRCVVSGDSLSTQPISTSFKHVSKVATFTRNGHLAIEYIRTCKWWQSPTSTHPMHKLSAYFCALENWHSAFHIKRPIDLWKWPVDADVQVLFQQESMFSESQWPFESALDSPTPDIESKSVRKLDSYFAPSSTDSGDDDVIAFSR